MRHRFHALCPYFAMFPESFAAGWIERLSEPGDVILDPFSGRGTTPFQALMMGRKAVACDTNPVAYCLTAAKTNAPALEAVKTRLDGLKATFDGRHWRHESDELGEFFRFAFSRKTLNQLVYLRASLNWRRSDADRMLAALVLGSLHGEMDRSTSYLSNQMPRTISTKPGYSVRYWRRHRLVAPERDVFALVRSRADFRYEEPPPKGTCRVYHMDLRQLPKKKRSLPSPIRYAITSPPYQNVTNFQEDQWLRLWFLGGPHYPVSNSSSRDDRHSNDKRYWTFISDMWCTFDKIMSPSAQVIIRIGHPTLNPESLRDALTRAATACCRRVQLVNMQVSEIRKRQTDAFRPGSAGIHEEIDCHYQFQS